MDVETSTDAGRAPPPPGRPAPKPLPLNPLEQRIARGPEAVSPITISRLLLIFSTAMILLIDPLPPTLTAPLQVLALLSYLLFGVLVVIFEWRGIGNPRSQDWIELLFGLLICGLTGGYDSVLFWMLLLPVTARSVRDGFVPAFRLALASLAALMLIGLLLAPQPLSDTRFYHYMRPLLLLVMSYVIARVGGDQRMVRRQLSLLATMNLVGNPRLGVERTLVSAAEHIRACFEMRDCVLLIRENDGAHLMVWATADDCRGDRIDGPSIGPLLEALGNQTVQHPRRFRGPKPSPLAIDRVGDLLGARCWMSTPFGSGEPPRGRVFLLDERRPGIDRGGLDFLADVAVQLTQTIDKVVVVDELSMLAADRERRRFAVDLHDRAIQPYLGIQLGLAAAMRRPGCPPEMRADLEALLAHSEHGVMELRAILSGHRQLPADLDSFRQALEGLTARLRHLFSMAVSLTLPDELPGPPRLATELVGLIHEALSNIVRHTPERRASVRMEVDVLRVTIDIDNPRKDATWVPFYPRSIAERAYALGGRVDILDLPATADTGPQTRVRIRIPL